MARKPINVEQSNDKISLLRDAVLAKAKGVHVMRMSDSQIAKRNDWLPTPSYDLNRILSGSLYKGLAAKTWTLIVGPEHSGKSSFMCLAAAEAQRQGYTPVVFDTEGAWDDKFVSRWGLKAENILYFYTPWVSDIKVAIAQIIETKQEKLIFIFDSIGGMDRTKIYDDSLAGDPKQDQGSLQKDLKSLYKLILFAVKSSNSIALSAGHFFGNPNSYSGADDIGGGKALKLFPDQIISLRKAKILDSNKRVIGNEITAITLKNRLYPPFNEAVINLDFKSGLDRFAGLASLAVDAGIIEKGGAWYTYVDENGEVHKYNGEAKLGQLFQENEESLIKKIDEWISTTGYSSINERVKEVYDEEESLSTLTEIEEEIPVEG